MINRLDTASRDFDDALERLIRWDDPSRREAEESVAAVLRDVRERGDAALLDYTARFDGVAAPAVDALRIDAGMLSDCRQRLPEPQAEALVTAARRIRRYHELQLRQGGAFEYEDGLGNRLGQRLMPLDRVGVYVPGGQAAYPSTVLMTVIPARVAGVREVAVTVPAPNGERNEHVLAALDIAGVDEVFAIGGAQAIAALAFGTETVARVDKIVGPGGAHVAAAKRQVFGPVGIDSIAGPSEVLIVADGSVPVHWTVLDMFSQSEHDAAAQALLLCPDAGYLDAVAHRMEAALPEMARARIIGASLGARGALIRTRDLDEAVAIANRVAPEHLQLAVADPEALLPRVRNAGAIFLGGYSAEVFGDYSAGPSHVLPTFGTARYASPLGVADFLRRSSVIRIGRRGVPELARTAATIAEVEGLGAHALAALARLDES
ncbi:MAG: histidinol dehydrogenase [Gammaproteobacteria bacterium]|nr:histidinol dehydrogenase [Gammaproteobacteria bacterium]